MSEEEFLGKHRLRTSSGKPQLPAQYTDKDFQLDVLGKLAETKALAETLEDSWRNELRANKDPNKVLRFDPRTLIAVGAIALSITGYVLQDARATSRRDAEIETTKVRVTNLERIAETNTEGRIRTEVQLEELRLGQLEIKRMIEARDNDVKARLDGKSPPKKAQPGG